MTASSPRRLAAVAVEPLGASADGPTLEEIRSTWPAIVDLTTACRAFGISRSTGYDADARGAFPARVITVGRRRKVITASIIAQLSATDAEPA